MSISKDPLGMNARNFLYITKYNKARAKRLADNKLETKKLLIRNEVPTSRIIKAFSNRATLNAFEWDLPQDGFVVKPARGFGGEGILVFNKWENGRGTTASGKVYSTKQIKSHILDIFEGIYSLQSLPDEAYIEEVIVTDNFFRKLTSIGLPDVRIIVFNKIPVMAMLRLPTPESGGKANLHAGAIGIGIGVRSGITNYAVWHNKHLRTIPGTKTKASGIRIPAWDEILLLASQAQSISGLGFAGVDIVVDKKRGPVILEVNSRPGLSIQIANRASLRERLERVEELPVQSIERGVEIAKSIFAEGFAERVTSESRVLSVIEPITIVSGNARREYRAKLDTGAYRTSLDTSVIEDLKLPLLTRKFKTISATGREVRQGVKVNMILAGRRITTIASVAERSHLKFPIIIGRRDLRGFYVNPAITAEKEEEIFEDIPENF